MYYGGGVYSEDLFWDPAVLSTASVRRESPTGDWEGELPSWGGAAITSENSGKNKLSCQLGLMPPINFTRRWGLNPRKRGGDHRFMRPKKGGEHPGIPGGGSPCGTGKKVRLTLENENGGFPGLRTQSVKRCGRYIKEGGEE